MKIRDIHKFSLEFYPLLYLYQTSTNPLPNIYHVSTK